MILKKYHVLAFLTLFMIFEHNAQYRITLFSGETITGSEFEVKDGWFKQYFVMDSITYQLKDVKSYRTELGMRYVNLAPASKNAFGTLINKGKINLYRHTTNQVHFNGGSSIRINSGTNISSNLSSRSSHGHFRSRTSVGYYFETNNQPIKFLTYKNIMPILEQNPACNDIVNRIKKKKRTGNTSLLACGILAATTAILISNAIDNEEFDPKVLATGGLTVFTGAFGIIKRTNNKKKYVEAVKIYNK